MEDKYTFETTDALEMELVTNRHRMIYALGELNDWRRELHNGKEYDTCYLCNGKVYTQRELLEATDLPRDEYGCITDCERIYLIDNVIKRIDGIMDDISDFIYQHYC